MNYLLKRNDNSSSSSVSAKLYFLLVFSFNLLIGQNSIQISGIVQDTLGQPLEQITVVLFDNDNHYISNYRTKKDGLFSFRFIPDRTNYVLKFYSMVYKTEDIVFKIVEELNEYDFTIIMSEETTVLEEIEIKSEPAIEIKKDTIVFQASRYLQKNDEILEDLLRNLPGVSIDPNGIVKINNIEIAKVLIGGDDIFNQNYKIATKNLDANDIEEIEIIYNFNENTVLQALTDSEQIAINIGIKDERLGAIYGKGNLGYGNDNNYLAGLTLFKLNKKIKTFLIGKLNTVGVRAQDNLNESMFSRSRNTNFESYKAFSNNVINTDIVVSHRSIPNTYVDDNKSLFNSVHILTKPRPNLSLRGVFYIMDDNINRRNSFNSVYTSPPVFSVFQAKSFNEEGREINGEINLKKANGNKSFFEYNGVINNSKQDSQIEFSTTTNNNFENLNIDDFYFSQHLNTTFRTSNKSAISLNLFYLQDNNPQNYSTNNSILNNQGVLSQLYENPIHHFGLQIELFNNKNKWSFGFLNKDEKLISRLSNDGDELMTDDFVFSNQLEFKQQDVFIFREFYFALGPNLNLTLDFKGGYNRINFTNNVGNLNSNGSNNQFYIEPKLNLVKQTKKLGKYSLGYNFSLRQPEIVDLYNGLLLTSNRGFTRGLNSLFNLYLHKVNLSYSISDFKRNIFLNTSLSYNYNQNSYGFQYLNTPELDILVKERADKNNTTLVTFKLNKNLSSIKSGFVFEYGGIYRRSFVNITGVEEIATNWVNNFSLKYGSYFNGKLNIKAGFNASYIKLLTSNSNNENNDFTSFFELLYEINHSMTFSLDTRQIYPSKLNSIDRVYNFIDLKFKYKIIKNKFEVNISGLNLTDVRNFQNNFVTLITNTDVDLFLNPAFLTLSASYRF